VPSSTGCDRANRSPSPIDRRLGATASSGAGIARIAASAAKPIANVATSTANAVPVPAAAIRTPPSDEPRIAAVFIPPHHSADVAGSSSRSTSRGIIASSDGRSSP
jgi:hypothetical protein